MGVGLRAGVWEFEWWEGRWSGGLGVISVGLSMNTMLARRSSRKSCVHGFFMTRAAPLSPLRKTSPHLGFPRPVPAAPSLDPCQPRATQIEPSARPIEPEARKPEPTPLPTSRSAHLPAPTLLPAKPSSRPAVARPPFQRADSQSRRAAARLGSTEFAPDRARTRSGRPDPASDRLAGPSEARNAPPPQPRCSKPSSTCGGHPHRFLSGSTPGLAVWRLWTERLVFPIAPNGLPSRTTKIVAFADWNVSGEGQSRA